MIEPSFIALLLAFKIAVAFLFVVAPLLNGSRAQLARAGGHDAAVAPLRLFGAAMLALVVGYATSFLELAAGRFPYGIVAMGIVADTAIPLTLVLTGQAWRTPLRSGLTLALFASAIGQIAACAEPQWALKPLF